MDDHDVDRELAELLRAEESKILGELLASARRLPPPAKFVQLRPHRWAALVGAVKAFIAPSPKRRPGKRERAMVEIEDYEKRRTL